MNMQSVKSVRHQPASPEASCFGSLFFGRIQPQVILLPVHHDLSNPFLLITPPRHSAMTRRTPTVSRGILHLRGTGRHKAEVSPSIVETVVIPVVNLDRIGLSQPEHFSVHPECSLLPIDPQRTVGVAMRGEDPAPSGYELGVASIHERVGDQFSVTPKDRHAGDAIFNGNGKALLHGLAPIGAPVFGPHPRRRPADRYATSRTGKMYGHRPSPVGGVTSPAGCNGAGTSHVNYTPYQIGGAG